MSKDRLNCLIRKSTLEDIGNILRLRRDSIEQLNSIDYSEEQIAVLRNEYIEGSNIQEEDLKGDILALFHFHTIKDNTEYQSSIVAQVENKIVGYAFISDLDLVTRSKVLYELFVCPEYTRQGVGTKLLQTLEEDALNRGCKVINVSASTTAELFYRTNNYQTIERGFFYKEGVRIPIIYMEKWLVNPTEIERFFWNMREQTIRNFNWLATEIEGAIRETF